jgi:hypothetical protein
VLLHDAGAWRGGGSAFASMARLIKRWDRQAGQQRENHPPPPGRTKFSDGTFFGLCGSCTGSCTLGAGSCTERPRWRARRPRGLFQASNLGLSCPRGGRATRAGRGELGT